MASDPPIRAADRDREQVVELLRSQTAEGRLTLDEFEQRMSSAYEATTWDELRRLTDDLPVRVSFGQAGVTSEEKPNPKKGKSSRSHARTAVPVVPVLVAVGLFLAFESAAVVPFIVLAVILSSTNGGCRSRTTRRHHGHHGFHGRAPHIHH